MTDIAPITPDEKIAPTAPEQAEPEHETFLESIASIATVLAVGLFVMTFVFQNFEIPSGSMENTLLIGDHVLVDRISLAPPALLAPFIHHRDVDRGDIIVFLKPHPETPDMYLVKRCVAVAGDHIHLNHGIVYINGVAQTEPYAIMPNDDGDPRLAYNSYRDDFPSVTPDPDDTNVTPSWQLDLPNHIVNGDLVVPPGFVFAMGDNRTESLDGRYWGFVPRENIVGRPLFIYWSFMTPDDQMYKTSLSERIAFMGRIVSHFISDTRWNRTLRVVH